MRIAAFLLVLAATAHSRPAGAGTDEEHERAKVLVVEGGALAKSGLWGEAKSRYFAAYQLTSPKESVLLFNVGQCYRHLEQLRWARYFFRKFIDEAPTHKIRPEAEVIIRNLDAELSGAPPAEPGEEVPPELRPAQPKTQPPRVIITPLEFPSPPVEKPGFARRHWWIFPVAAVVLAAVAVGLVFGLRSTDVGCSRASLGCLFPPAH